MKKLIAIVLLLSGCATIDKQIEGWPVLKVTEHEVGFWEVQSACIKYAPLWIKLLVPVYLACAEVNLYKLTCNIYHLKDASEYVMTHERSHCTGGDHGDMQEYFDKWKSKQK